MIFISFADMQQYSPLMNPSGVLPEKVPQASLPSKLPPLQVISEPTFPKVTDIGPDTGIVKKCAITLLLCAMVAHLSINEMMLPLARSGEMRYTTWHK